MFEERYRLLIGRCIDEKIPFGVVYHRGESIRQIGCSAVVARVVKEYDDGRLDIIAVGHERFQIDAVDDTGPYLEAQVRFFDESQADDDAQLADHAVAELLKYAYYSEVSLDRPALDSLTVSQLSFLIAGIDVLGMDTKQALLETDDAMTRLRMAVDELEKINHRLVNAARIKAALGVDVEVDSFLN